MDKKKLMGLVFPLALLAACSSDEGAGVTTEPAGDLDTKISVLPKDPYSAEHVAIMDSILKTMEKGGASSEEISSKPGNPEGSIDLDSVPKTGHDFETSGEIYYSRQGCNVTYYEEESGTQMLFTGNSADYMETSLLLTKDEVMVEKVDNVYWFEEDQEDCEADLTAFRQRCESLYGVFRDYNDGTGCNDFRHLQVACAVPLFGLTITPEVLTHEADYYYKARCDSMVVAEGPQCSIVCTDPSGNNLPIDTLHFSFDNIKCEKVCVDEDGERIPSTGKGYDDDSLDTRGGHATSSTSMSSAVALALRPEVMSSASMQSCYTVCENSLDGKCETVCHEMDGENDHFDMQDDDTTFSAPMPEVTSSASMQSCYTVCEKSLGGKCEPVCTDGDGEGIPSIEQDNDTTFSALMPEVMSSASMQSCYTVCENSLDGKCETVCHDMGGENGHFDVQDGDDDPLDAQGEHATSSTSMSY